jgi:hypothetical protein
MSGAPIGASSFGSSATMASVVPKYIAWADRRWTQRSARATVSFNDLLSPVEFETQFTERLEAV